jgi:hypothetical protein
VDESGGGGAAQLVEAVSDLAAAGASVGVVKVNAEEASELKHQYAIRGYPSLKLFRKGKFSEDYTVRAPLSPPHSSGAPPAKEHHGVAVHLWR